MSVYLGYDTITKQYLRDLVSNNQKSMTEWTNYYANVSTSMTYPHGLDNYPCPIRNDEITESTSIVIKTLSFDDVAIAELSQKTLDVKARFVRPDKSVVVKDLVSIDLSTKFSKSMFKDKSGYISCFVVNEKINVGDAKGAALFQIGVKFSASITNTPELAVIYAIG